jgi:hypothetical protein
MKKITNMSEIKIWPKYNRKISHWSNKFRIGEKITENGISLNISLKTIANQYTPKLVEDEYIPLTYTVYLANTLNGLSLYQMT